MHDCIRLADASEMDVGVRSHVMFMAYARLFTIEQDAGNQELASRYFTSAIVWHAKTSATNSGVLTHEDLREAIHNWDDAWTTNAGPRFRRRD